MIIIRVLFLIFRVFIVLSSIVSKTKCNTLPVVLREVQSYSSYIMQLLSRKTKFKSCQTLKPAHCLGHSGGGLAGGGDGVQYNAWLVNSATETKIFQPLKTFVSLVRVSSR